MKSRGIFYKIKQNTKQNITHRRDEFTSRRRALLYCIRFCHSLLIMPKLSSLNPDRSAIPQKSATFSNCKSAAHFRPPSTQLKPISIFSKGEFEAAHSRKVGICCGSQPQGRFCYGSQPPDNLHSTIAKPRPFRYPSKICNIIKGRNSQRRPAAYSCSAKL